MALVAGLLVGCAGFSTRPEPPSLSLSGIRSVELREHDARMGMRFEASNPNAAELEISAVEFDVAIEGVPVASGRTARPFVLPAGGTVDVDVDVITPFEKLAAASRAAAARKADRIRYDISGRAFVGDQVVPFQRVGEIGLPTPRALGLP